MILGQLAVSEREALRKRRGQGAGKAEAVDWNDLVVLGWYRTGCWEQPFGRLVNSLEPGSSQRAGAMVQPSLHTQGQY